MTSRSAVTFCNFQQNQYFWSVILKVSQKGFGNSRILVHCRFSSYFTLITKKKLHFSLTCSFYYCLMRRRWALKVAWQFAIRELFAYKRVAYKKLNLRHLSSVFPVHCLKRFWSSKVLSFKSMLFQGHCNFRSLEFDILSINLKFVWTEKENNDNVES